MTTSTQNDNYYSTDTTSSWTLSMGSTSNGIINYNYYSTYYTHFEYVSDPYESAAVRKRKKLINETRSALMPDGDLFEI